MDEFRKQIIETRKRNVIDFINNKKYAEIKNMYILNFERIVSFIEKSNPRLAIEDVANLDSTLSKTVIENLLFFKEVNQAIANGELSLIDLKRN